ncbi:hypothetical protein D3C86_2159770 [compost metagenome]
MQGLFERLFQRDCILQILPFNPCAQLIKQRLRGVDADIRSQQDGFQFIINVFIYLAAAKQRAELATQLLAGFRQAVF